LKACVESVLAQTYPNFELVVLDDASTDGTRDWLAGVGDRRVRVCPAPARHLGIVDNWARIRTLPKNEFLTILGQDDLLDPDYLSVVTALIHEQPDASLYHAHFRFMDAAGRVRRSCGPLPARETAGAWLSDLCRPGARDNLHATGYVARSADYDAVGGIPGFENLLFADYVLWLRLAHRSYKATAPDACFSCRLHERSVSGAADALSYVRAIPPYFAF